MTLQFFKRCESLSATKIQLNAWYWSDRVETHALRTSDLIAFVTQKHVCNTGSDIEKKELFLGQTFASVPCLSFSFEPLSFPLSTRLPPYYLWSGWEFERFSSHEQFISKFLDWAVILIMVKSLNPVIDVLLSCWSHFIIFTILLDQTAWVVSWVSWQSDIFTRLYFYSAWFSNIFHQQESVTKLELWMLKY